MKLGMLTVAIYIVCETCRLMTGILLWDDIVYLLIYGVISFQRRKPLVNHRMFQGEMQYLSLQNHTVHITIKRSVT